VLGWVFMQLSQARQMISGQVSSSAAGRQGGQAGRAGGRDRGMALSGLVLQVWHIKFTTASHTASQLLRLASLQPQPSPTQPSTHSPMGTSRLHHTHAQCLPYLLGGVLCVSVASRQLLPSSSDTSQRMILWPAPAAGWGEKGQGEGGEC
jgi:hypothetical protein